MPKITNNCSKCGHSYTLGPDTAELHYFAKAPGYSYLDAECPFGGCGQEEWIFPLGNIKPSDLLAYEWKTYHKDYPSPNEKATYYRATGTTEVVGHPLTQRLEDLVTKLGKTLNSTPDDVLLDLFEAPPPKSYLPQRWS